MIVNALDTVLTGTKLAGSVEPPRIVTQLAWDHLGEAPPRKMHDSVCLSMAGCFTVSGSAVRNTLGLCVM